MKKVLLVLLISILFIPISVNAESHFLYDVLKSNSGNNGLTKKYSGQHKDSFTTEGTKDIYYWDGSNNTKINQINEKNNVIFGGFCWQTVRTTDTGGVKLIYNGSPSNGKCNNTGTAQEIGKSVFGPHAGSVSSVGYMYNKIYDYNLTTRKYDYPYTFCYATSVPNTFYYANSFEYDSNTNKYTLIDPLPMQKKTDFRDLVGKYTFLNSNSNYYGTTIYYVISVPVGIAESGNIDYIEVTDGYDYTHFNHSYSYGETYSINNDGTYALDVQGTIYPTDYISSYSNLKNKYVCKDGDISACHELWYVIASQLSNFLYITTNQEYKYANSFIYNDATNTYTLSDDSIYAWELEDNTVLNELNNHHYTCLNKTGECTMLAYAFDYSNHYIHYINLTNGESIEDALYSMLYADDVNTTDSTMKTKLEEWYSNKLNNYSNYIENTIFCNDRTISSLGSWDPNGGRMGSKIVFTGGNGLECQNATDQFSVDNPKAKINYSIGLLTNEEMRLLGNKALLKTGTYYHLFTPADYLQGARNKVLNDYGYIETYLVSYNLGVRPVISLEPKTRYESGDGSKNNPYIIDYNNYYGIDIEINNETEDLSVEIDDLTTVAEGETVNFRVTPIKGRKVTSIRIVDANNQEINYTTIDNKNFTFTMPSSDVTIIPTYERVKNAVNVKDNINTKEIKIEVNDATAVVYEDTVRFKVVPEEGYEVDKIDITDEEQNKIRYKKTNTVNEYEFTMPDSDVLIKPSYRLISNSNEVPNPNTGRIYLFIIFLLTIIGVITFKYKKKRLNN